MFESFQEYLNEYDDIIANNSDPRTKDWVVTKSPLPTLCGVVMYLLFVKIIGPNMMKNRNPVNLRYAMIFYNGLQTVICIYLFVAGGYYGYFTRYNLICQPNEPFNTDPEELVMLDLAWLFYLVRFLEFTDTVFFILRKKFSQVSNLHVVHHAIVPLFFWAGIKFVPTGHYTFCAYLNSFVHIFMYLYYMLAALGPRFQKYLWWKRYMTILQLAQFVIVMVHTVNTVVSDCPVPKFMAGLVLFQAVLFFIMFVNFYISAFRKSRNQTNNKPLVNNNFTSKAEIKNHVE